MGLKIASGFGVIDSLRRIFTSSGRAGVGVIVGVGDVVGVGVMLEVAVILGKGVIVGVNVCVLVGVIDGVGGTIIYAMRLPIKTEPRPRLPKMIPNRIQRHPWVVRSRRKVKYGSLRADCIWLHPARIARSMPEKSTIVTVLTD
jgi:hypothetical protein